MARGRRMGMVQPVAAERGARERDFIARSDPATLRPYALLERRLLAVGGVRMVMTFDEHCALLLDAGRVMDAPACPVAGAPSQCHVNVADRVRAGEGDPCTGYALSEDGLWRCHSWLQTPSGELLETTAPRERYFGIVLAGDARDDFLWLNI